MTPIRVTVSGSFRRHLNHVQRAVEQLTVAGATVLSPASPTVVDRIEDFVFVASDVHRSPRLVQDRHMAAIAESDFLWLVCPEGYVGQSASLEIGYAIAQGVPVWAMSLPDDLTLRQYITTMHSCMGAVSAAQRLRVANKGALKNILLTPDETVDEIHRSAESLRDILTTNRDILRSEPIARQFDSYTATISRVLTVSGRK